jgi:hypothetical protein
MGLETSLLGFGEFKRRGRDENPKLQVMRLITRWLQKVREAVCAPAKTELDDKTWAADDSPHPDKG